MQSLLYNSLERGGLYIFVLGADFVVEGRFHEYMPDGTLKVTLGNGRILYINPNNVFYVISQ
jgi:hypothetical protein